MREINRLVNSRSERFQLDNEDTGDVLRESIAQSYFYNPLKTKQLQDYISDKKYNSKALNKYLKKLTNNVVLPNQKILNLIDLVFKFQKRFFFQNKVKKIQSLHLPCLQKKSFESQLYELLNNALKLLVQNLKDGKLVLIYFELVVNTIQKICNENFYILIYEICKSVDKIIKQISVVIKETKQFDILMMKYYYYRGFSQINFDAKHKFYDYTMTKQFFFKINYKDYLHVDLDFTQQILDDSSQNSIDQDDTEKKDNFNNFLTSFQEKVKKHQIKKQTKDFKKKEQMKGIELGFIDFFFQCYILFRYQKNKFKQNRHDLLKQTLNIYAKNQNFDLGVSQIHKCYFFLQDMKECESFQQRCLRVVRQVMKKEQLINHSQSEQTIYEKYNEISDEERCTISQVDNQKKPLLIKYLKQLAEIYIYSNQNVICFLNIYRCLSILSESYYYKYLLYLEQLQWKASELIQDQQYEILVEEIENDLKNRNEAKQLFWKLSYQKMKESLIRKQINFLNVDLKKDQPILYIRKIMNNIYLQIQNQTDDNIFTVLFKVDYNKFIEKWNDHCEKRKQQKGNDVPLTAYTSSLKFKNQLVFLKMYSLKGQYKPDEIEFSYQDYFFVQEVAIAIYLRDKQHQKYQSFHESIGYNCFNRYIYHFIQDNKIFLILEYYPILYQDILGNGHFKYQIGNQNRTQFNDKDASQPNTQRGSKQQPSSKEGSIKRKEINSSFQKQSTQATKANNQRTQENILQLQQQSEIELNLTSATSLQNQQNMINTKNVKFTIKDLFFIMLRSEQASYMLKENCIIHKDLKLLNIAMRSMGEIVFIDFGISELFLEFSYCMDNSGTQLYRSYQQASSQPISENTDLSALIIVIYELIKGEKIDLTNSGTNNYASYISKNASKEINFLFSKDFIKLIEMICDSQLDTVKSRTKYFMWQKFEIFMNLLYDCLEKNSQIEYQKYYQQVKKAIINIAVKRKKPNLEVQFDYQLLINLMSDDIFLMLVSLQSSNILKMYESLLFVVIKERKMKKYYEINENTIYQEIIEELTNHMDYLKKQINQFQQITCENIRQTYSKTDSIKEQMEFEIKQYQKSKNNNEENKKSNSELQNYKDNFQQAIVQINKEHNPDLVSIKNVFSSIQNQTLSLRNQSLTDHNQKTDQFIIQQYVDYQNNTISSSTQESQNLQQAQQNTEPDIIFNNSIIKIEDEQTKKEQTQQRESIQKQKDILKNKSLNNTQSIKQSMQ